MRRKYLGGLVAIAVAVSGLAAMAPGATAAGSRASTSDARSLAKETARNLVDSRAPQLKIGPHDGFAAPRVFTGQAGLQYVSYERTYRGLPVVGGDFVVVTDKTGHVLSTSVAQTPRRPASPRSRRPSLPHGPPAIAKAPARRASTRPRVRALVVWQGKRSVLAWETTRRPARKPASPRASRCTSTRAPAASSTRREHVIYGTGTGNWEGAVTHPDQRLRLVVLDDQQQRHTLRCQNSVGQRDVHRHRRRVGQRQRDRPRDRLRRRVLLGREGCARCCPPGSGRNGMNGSGGWVPIRVGLNDVNAYYDGTQVQIGHRQGSNEWIGAMDVVAHEFGHGIDDKTPGGISGGGTQEFVGDTFGAATEFFANNPADAPDYLDRRGDQPGRQGPIRNMYNPSAVGDPNCYSSSHPERRGARGRRPRQPLVLPARRGHQPGRRQPDQLDLQRLDGHRHRHPEGHEDHVQRDADEDVDLVVPEVPHLDADRGQEPLPGQLRGVQRGQGRLERRLGPGPDRRPDLRHRRPRSRSPTRAPRPARSAPAIACVHG